MNCPACKEPMVIIEFNKVETDYCTNCGGIWLDSGELELLSDNDSLRSDINSRLKSLQKSGEKKLKCPICRKKMEKVTLENSNLTLDHCLNNDGLWFDEGELVSALSISGESENNFVVQHLKKLFANRNQLNNKTE